MKILYMSHTGELNGAASRGVADGHEVRLFGSLPQLSDVPRSIDWRPDARRSDLVVIDKSSASKEAAPAALRVIARFVLGGQVDLTLHNYFGRFLAFFNGLEWLKPQFEIASLDTMLAGDLGAEAPNTAVALTPSRFPPAYWLDSMEAATEALKSADYRGPVRFDDGQVNARICPAELAAIGELLTTPLTTVLYDIAAARALTLPVVAENALALRLSVPPYPWAKLTDDTRPEVAIVPGAAKHFWAADANLQFGQVGWSGLLGYASARGRGRSLREAGRRLEHVLSGISGRSLHLQYRTDSVAKLNNRWERVHGTD